MYLDGTTVKYEAFSDGRRFTYMYDANGELYAVRLATYSNPTASAIYYYVYNLQGDVIALVNSANGQIVARYEYDAWGKPIAITDANGNAITDQSHIAHVNPFRYRGYYYDNETGLYYLNSRYYDPETGRFVSADGVLGLNSGSTTFNTFSYCNNNSINYIDKNGNFGVAMYEEMTKRLSYQRAVQEKEAVDAKDQYIRDNNLVYIPNGKKFDNYNVKRDEDVPLSNVEYIDVTFIKPDASLLKDQFIYEFDVAGFMLNTAIGIADIATGTKITGSLLLMFSVLSEISDYENYTKKVDVIQSAVANGNGIVIYKTGTYSPGGTIYTTHIAEWKDQYGTYPYAKLPGR